MKGLLFLYFFILPLLLLPLSKAMEVEWKSFQDAFLKSVIEINDRSKKDLKSLGEKYLVALNRLLEKEKQSGNLDTSVALTSEIERWKLNAEMPDSLSELEMIKKHQKPNPQMEIPGGIIEKEAPIAASNVAIWNGEAAKGGEGVQKDGYVGHIIHKQKNRFEI